MILTVLFGQDLVVGAYIGKPCHAAMVPYVYQEDKLPPYHTLP